MQQGHEPAMGDVPERESPPFAAGKLKTANANDIQ